MAKINSSLVALAAAALLAHSAHGMEGMALAAAARSACSSHAMQDNRQFMATIFGSDVKQLVKALQEPLTADTITSRNPRVVEEMMQGKRLTDEANVFLQETQRLRDERDKVIAQLEECTALREGLCTRMLALRNQQAVPHDQGANNLFALSIAHAAAELHAASTLRKVSELCAEFELQGGYMKVLLAQAEDLAQEAKTSFSRGTELQFSAETHLKCATALTVLNEEHDALNKETETSNNMQS